MKVCRLDEIALVTMGQSPKSEFYNSIGDGMPFLQGNRTFGRMYPSFDTYTTNITRTAEAGDVIMSVRAPVGDLNITPVKMCLGRGVCSIHMKNDNQSYLFYLLKYNMPKLLNKESGTVFGSVNRNDINGLEVCVHSDVEQIKIAEFLKNIDDKIEENNKINNNLEEQLSAIFVHTFSDITEPVCELETLIEVKDGTHDSPKPQKEGHFLITSKHLLPYGVDRSSANLITSEDFDKINQRSLVNKYDVLMSMIGTVGLISLVCDDVVDFAIKNVALFKTSDTYDLLYYFLCYLKSKDAQQHIEMCLAGSTQKYISLSELRKMPIIKPDERILAYFNNIVEPIFQQIILNNKENMQLSTMRDALLPKLMSGELDVSEINI